MKLMSQVYPPSNLRQFKLLFWSFTAPVFLMLGLNLTTPLAVSLIYEPLSFGVSSFIGFDRSYVTNAFEKEAMRVLLDPEPPAALHQSFFIASARRSFGISSIAYRSAVRGMALLFTMM